MARDSMDMTDIYDLGLMEYSDAIRVQADIMRKRIEGEIPDALIMAEHFPVVTMGRLTDGESIIDRGYFEERGIPLIPTDRGGKVTYHSPGQLVMYPVIDLRDKKKDIGFYIDFLEKTVVEGLAAMGVKAERLSGRRGVWSGARKIAFTGIAVKKWVTCHGVSINLNNDTEPFLMIHPCGEKDIRVTSAIEITGEKADMDEAKNIFADRFCSCLSREYGRPVSLGV